MAAPLKISRDALTENEIYGLLYLTDTIKKEVFHGVDRLDHSDYLKISEAIGKLLPEKPSQDTVERIFLIEEDPRNYSKKSLNLLCQWHTSPSGIKFSAFLSKEENQKSIQEFINSKEHKDRIRTFLDRYAHCKATNARDLTVYDFNLRHKTDETQIQKESQTKKVSDTSNDPTPKAGLVVTHLTTTGPLAYLNDFVDAVNKHPIVYSTIILDKSSSDDGSERHMFEPNNQFFWKLKDSKDRSMESYVAMVQEVIEKISEKPNVTLQRTDKPGCIVLREPSSGIVVVIRRIEL